jgi:hypothetical protein
MINEYRHLLAISHSHLDELNAVLLDPNERVVNDILEVPMR